MYAIISLWLISFISLNSLNAHFTFHTFGFEQVIVFFLVLHLKRLCFTALGVLFLWNSSAVSMLLDVRKSDIMARRDTEKWPLSGLCWTVFGSFYSLIWVILTSIRRFSPTKAWICWRQNVAQDQANTSLQARILRWKGVKLTCFFHK